MRTYIIIPLILLLSARAVADDLTISRFLASVKTDYKLANHTELVNYLENASTSTPYIDRIEFRSETEEFDILKQRYSLRFYPKGWGETGYNEQLADTTRKANRIEHEAYLNSALKQRYRLVLDYLELTALLKLHRDLLVVLQDRVTVLRKQSASVMSFDVNPLIAADDKVVDLQLEIVKLEDQLTSKVHMIQTLAKSKAKVAFDEKELVPIAKIERVAGSLAPDADIDNVALQDRKLKIKLANIKYNLEVAKNRDYISFVKLSFDTEDYTNLQKAFSIGFAIKMPFINPDRYEINRRKLRYLNEKLQYEDQRRATSERIISISRSLRRLIRQQNILKQRKDGGDAKSSFKQYMAMEGVNPLTLLKIKESIILGDIRMARLQNAIRLRYVDLTSILGKLLQRPLKNHISTRNEVIE